MALEYNWVQAGFMWKELCAIVLREEQTLAGLSQSLSTWDSGKYDRFKRGVRLITAEITVPEPAMKRKDIYTHSRK